MTVRVWRSFSANNSADYRLVARFVTPEAARQAAADFNALRGEAPGEAGPEGPLAQVLGFDWDEYFPYGHDDDPSVIALGSTLVLYHSYCLGLPDQLAQWFVARGAQVDPMRSGHEGSGLPHLSVLFALPSQALREELETALETLRQKSTTGRPWPDVLPWLNGGWGAKVAWFCDGHTFGFYAPVRPLQVPLLKEWLADRGVTSPSLALCVDDDYARFTAIARARCAACGAPLRYLEPQRFGLDGEALACDACGAMYDLTALRAREPP